MWINQKLNIFQSEKKFRWNNIHRTKMADERFFIQEPVKNIRGNYVTFRSHENLGKKTEGGICKDMMKENNKKLMIYHFQDSYYCDCFVDYYLASHDDQIVLSRTVKPGQRSALMFFRVSPAPSPQTTTRRPIFMIDPRFVVTVPRLPPYRGTP